MRNPNTRDCITPAYLETIALYDAKPTELGFDDTIMAAQLKRYYVAHTTGENACAECRESYESLRKTAEGRI